MAVIPSQSTQPTHAQHASERSARRRLFALLTPGVLWLVLFFWVPLLVIMVYSFASRSSTGDIAWTWTLNNYRALFADTLYLQVFARSFGLALVTTLICLVIGFPLALYIARQRGAYRAALVFAIMIPFWTNFLVRIYAWRFLLNNTGLINTLLEATGLPTLSLINTPTAVLIGLVYGELPFMVLPLYAALERFDWTLLEAAQDLYASRWRTFWRVMLPLTMPGIAAGSVLVFVPTVGQFVVPELLGGSKVAMLGNVLERQFRSAQNAPLGSAIALVFMAALTLMITVYFRTTTEETR
jgi:spermidine/putrescine transport system permease protein